VERRVPDELMEKNLNSYPEGFAKGQEDGASTTSDSSHGSGEFDVQAPLLAYTTSNQPKILKIFSLKSDKTLHIYRFGSSILKVSSTSSTNLSQLFVLLQEGQLKIFDLKSMEQIANIRTFQMCPSKNGPRSHYD